MYCAFVLCYLLDAFDSIDVDAAVAYLLRCRVRLALFRDAVQLLPRPHLTRHTPPLFSLA